MCNQIKGGRIFHIRPPFCQTMEGKERAFYILHLMNRTGYIIPPEKQEILIRYFNEELGNFSARLEDHAPPLSATILYQALFYQIFFELGAPIDRAKIYGLVDLLVTEYPNLGEPLLVTRWMVTLMQSYKVDKNQVKSILNRVDLYIQHSNYSGLCSFCSQAYPSFEATYHALAMRAYLL